MANKKILKFYWLINKDFGFLQGDMDFRKYSQNCIQK